ncbi:glutamate 5-kinase [uncultured Ferrovibrio sp.]|jgi:glutamate 5-kinase|uniref:glutamate 5-kinase n=1 Tax=uncultured Ferrovibrio sp. TaxID=1576913 RepID=UPI002620788E|nr:glutamate 5-kinase [uncultured Ferrovibrio sp.]
MTDALKKAKRVVVKVGSSLLVDSEKGTLRAAWLNALVDDIAALREEGKDVLVVSSGAIALGRRILGLPGKTLRLDESQAAAAAGQIRLSAAWQEALARHDLKTAQILLTLGDTESRRHYLNARETVHTLLKLGVVPVINENDTVATAEIRFGDNDRLAARVAQMISADCLVLLSDIDGLYSADPGLDPNAKFFPVIEQITPEIEAMAGVSRSGLGRGGMITKILAAKIAVGAGCAMVIANGKVMHPVKSIRDGGRCSWFLAEGTPSAARKQWIAGHLNPQGSITVDAGAVKALKQGRSLLPAGVTDVEGRFQRGDLVRVLDPEGIEIAVGLSAYADEDARRIKGHKSGDIAEILGYGGRDEMIHRDDLVLR